MNNKMNDLGETYPMTSCGCDDCKDNAKDKKQEKHYPRESFTTEQMPELKGANVGDKVKIVIEAVVCAVSQGDEYAMGPGESDTNPPKTRVSLKMMSGSAEKQGTASPAENKTMSETMDQKANDFEKTIGIEDGSQEE